MSLGHAGDATRPLRPHTVSLGRSRPLATTRDLDRARHPPWMTRPRVVVVGGGQNFEGFLDYRGRVIQGGWLLLSPIIDDSVEKVTLKLHVPHWHIQLLLHQYIAALSDNSRIW